MPLAYLHPPGQTQAVSADDEKCYFISPHVRLGLSRCQPLSARVRLCAPTRVFAVRVIFDCVCLRWGRCSFSCSFHDHYITCGIFAATGVYFHPCESWSKLLFKHRLETEIFSNAQTASPIKMIELPLINNSYWKHSIMRQRCHFIRKKWIQVRG